MTISQLRPEGLSILRDQLSGRSIAIVSQIADLKLMTGQHVKLIHFPASDHDSAASAARAARRCLEMLARERLLVRLQRRVGGARAGSSSYIYVLGPVGHRLLELRGPRPRYREPSTSFIDHTLAVTQLVVNLTLATRNNDVDLLVCQPEPRCWRSFSWRGAPTSLKPDLFVSLGIGDFEHRWFCEVDNGTEHIPAVVKKCRQYEAYYRSGHEQADHGVFPRVCWLVRDEKRAEHLRKAIDKDPHLTDRLFVTGLQRHATSVLGSTQ